MMKLSIIMPVYNEEKTIDIILNKIIEIELELEKEIIVIDDASTDGTKEKLIKYENKAQILYHEKNKGKGAAIRTGLKESTGDIIAIQDADLEYNPEDLKNLIQPIIEGKAQVVYGSRFKGQCFDMFFLQKLANKCLTLLINILYGAKLTDMETCYKVFKREVIKDIILRSNRFEIEAELTAKILKQGYKIYELPISYVSRSYKEGKKIKWKDGLITIYTLMKYRVI